MANISVSPAELRSEAGFVKGQAADAQASFEALKARLQDLTNVFTGAAQQGFSTRYEEWHRSAQGLTDSLDSLGQFLTTAADTLEDVDQQLAQGITGS